MVPSVGHARSSVTGASVAGWSYIASTVIEPMRKYPCAFHHSKTTEHATAESFLKSFQH